MAGYTINISFFSDGLRLDGVLHHPGTEKPPIVVGSHGLESNGDSPKQIELAETLSEMGIAFFRFHHRGCGTSEGFFPDVTTLENRKRDLVQAVRIILERNDIGKRLGLFGSSIGGSTCIAATREIPTAECFVIIAPPVCGSTLTKAPDRDDKDPILDSSFYDRLLKFDLSTEIPLMKKILIFHGDSDDIVPLENGRTVYRLAGEPKKIIIQENGDHRITAPGHQAEFIREASNWFKTHLKP